MTIAAPERPAVEGLRDAPPQAYMPQTIEENAEAFERFREGECILVVVRNRRNGPYGGQIEGGEIRLYYPCDEIPFGGVAGAAREQVNAQYGHVAGFSAYCVTPYTTFEQFQEYYRIFR